MSSGVGKIEHLRRSHCALSSHKVHSSVGAIDNLDPFFYFYIHKCMWSTPASVRSMAAGLKKFYKCMAEHEIIEEED
ncbi:MAG: hypothetical protein UFA98_08410, partial [Ruminococcus sp.]|nr:hypothetical protein [Ruminococcus sp.]